MNDLKIFNNEEFGEIRTVAVNGEPMFCLVDICKALEIKNATDVAKRLDEDERTRLNLGRQGETNFITESGLYAVILRSDKPNAKKFRKWVTSEVLPSIRKTGSYNKPMTTAEKIHLLAQSDEELTHRVDEVKAKGVETLGGKDSNSYKDRSLRGRVYADIHREVKRQFGVTTYKAIKRNQCEKAVAFVRNYNVPFVLQEEIAENNAQLNLEVTAWQITTDTA